MNFVIKFPTRGRKRRFFDVLAKWIGYLSGKHAVQFVITLDNDDAEMNTPEVREKLDTLPLPDGVKLKYVFGNSKSKIEAVNADLEGVTGDILICASDDMTPVVQGYDDIIAEAFKQHFPLLDGAIRFWDGSRKKDPLMTIAVMGWRLYEAFGYIYPPDYVTIRRDREQTIVCQAIGKFMMVNTCIIKHRWGVVRDEMLKKNHSSPLRQLDYAVFNRRRQIEFDIPELCSRLHCTTMKKVSDVYPWKINNIAQYIGI